ncbi:2-phosphosulfolactate phosphatase [Paenibacillus psychroresistens]|nr:2-phosphosulfolactate phosphatase [Paenibacillus psychroresistens]
MTNQTVIVIDVLRATSNMITALMFGCIEIIPLETIEEAKSLKVSGDLLGGERNCLKLPDFDLGNSPYEYMTPQVFDKRILMTTTNGTRVIQQANSAKHVLAGAFINAHACALAALELQDDITILCAGTNDAFSWEDGLCAGFIVHELQQITGQSFQVNDFGLCMLTSYLEVEQKLNQALLESANGKKLTLLGFESDILYCSKVNIMDAVPVLYDGKLISHRSKNVCPS